MRKSTKSLDDILGSWAFRSFQAKPTVLSTIITYSVFGLLLIIFAGVLFTINSKTTSIKISDYGATCRQTLHTDTPCNVTFEVKENMKGPVYLLYELNNFHQNHKRFFSSKNNYQLAGGVISEFEAHRTCDPVVYNRDLEVNVSWGGVALDPNAIASPCGLVPKSVFNDSFNLQTVAGSPVNITKSGISWPRDQGIKFKRSPNSSSLQWIDPENQAFIVWMRTSSLPTFEKLYGKIQGGLTAGNYTFLVTNNYDMAQYNGQKSLVLTTGDGGISKNSFSASVTLIYGLLCLGGAGVFLYRQRTTQGKFGPKNLDSE